MRQGRMDPSGMGMTQAGMILGIILTIFNLLCCGFYGVMFVIGVANGEIR